jgi:hypothetical protein
MMNGSGIKTVGVRCVEFILLTALFALIYTQAPLYTSNQNQYFLQGLARGGLGHLSEDWLANTPDSMPVFSALVKWTYSLTHLEALFYGYYALLMGIYLFSALGIVNLVFPLRDSQQSIWNGRSLVYLALFLLVHSAAWRFFLSRTLGDNWTYVLEDGVADQRLLGTVLEPSVFGVFLVLSIYLFLKNRPYWAVLCAALAASFHPTYLLGAAALTAAYALVRLLDLMPQMREAAGSTRLRLGPLFNAIVPGVVALLAVLPILVYVYLNFASSPPALAAQAREILVNYRIPHHAIPAMWFDATAMVKICLVVFALYLVRKTRLFWVLGVPFITAVALTIVQVLSGSTMLALLFPWRISVFLVPLSTALVLAWLVNLTKRWSEPDASYLRRTWVRRGALVASVSLILVLAVIGAIRLKLDFERQPQAEDRPLFAYVASHLASGQLYLIPIKMQDFRLASGAPAYVDFKAHPYQDADVLEWYRRVQLSNRFYKQADCDLLSELVVQEGITHVVLPAGQTVCPELRLVYQEDAYSLFAVGVK